MKTLSFVLFAAMLAGCSPSQWPDDHISRISEKLQPVVDDWRTVCQAGRTCLEASGQDTRQFVEACERGWAVFQAIEAYQVAYCEMRGLECSEISSK